MHRMVFGNTQKRVAIITQLTSTQTWSLEMCACGGVKWSEVNEAEPRFQRPPTSSCTATV